MLQHKQIAGCQLHVPCRQSSKHFHFRHWKLPYSVKLSREKTFAKWWQIWFLLRKFSQIGRFCSTKVPHPQILQRKLSRIAIKPRNSQKFSPSKASRYMVFRCSSIPFRYSVFSSIPIKRDVRVTFMLWGGKIGNQLNIHKFVENISCQQGQ